MFERIDIRLTSPLCVHRPSGEESPWKWSIIATPVNGEPVWSLLVYCNVCNARLEVPPHQFVALITVNGVAAADLPQPERQDGVAEPVKPRHPPVVHSRTFTPYDRRICKSLGIKFDEE